MTRLLRQFDGVLNRRGSIVRGLRWRTHEVNTTVKRHTPIFATLFRTFWRRHSSSIETLDSESTQLIEPERTTRPHSGRRSQVLVTSTSLRIPRGDIFAHFELGCRRRGFRAVVPIVDSVPAINQRIVVVRALETRVRVRLTAHEWVPICEVVPWLVRTDEVDGRDLGTIPLVRRSVPAYMRC